MQVSEPLPSSMNPKLSIMCGPMLRYDTVENGVWHGFALIVTADSKSNYDTVPTLYYRFGGSTLNGQGDPQNAKTVHAPAQKIYQFHGSSDSHSFWRFKIEVTLGDAEMPVTYSINGGAPIQFYVPARNQNFHWVGHSCNGFSASVDTSQFNGSDPLWKDLLKDHERKPVHAIIGGGDQIYCDALAKEPEFEHWITSPDMEWKKTCELTDTMKTCMENFFFNHYCSWFRSGSFGHANSCIPMLNILDDHDLIDGFGSYPDDLMNSSVFSSIGRYGYFWYQLFQSFICPEFDGYDQANHSNKSIIIGGPGPFIKMPNQSFLSYLGPQVYILLLDCRAERKKYQVCSQQTYDLVFKHMAALPNTVSHIVMLLGVPIAYPRMNFIENVLDSKFNPLVILAKKGMFGLGGFVNKFNAEAELLDDLNDHWTAKHHKKERNELVRRCAEFAESKGVRISFLSGDVHCGAVGRFLSLKKKDPKQDPKYMLNIVSSAIVNTPPPAALIKLVGNLGSHKHRTLYSHGIDENMVPIWDTDTDGSELSNKLSMGRRNYVRVDYLTNTNELQWDMRMEIKQGDGETKGYQVCAPSPEYSKAGKHHHFRNMFSHQKSRE